MPYKICPHCRQTSYSAAAVQIWICPCCGEEISDVGNIRDPRMIFSNAVKRRVVKPTQLRKIT